MQKEPAGGQLTVSRFPLRTSPRMPFEKCDIITEDLLIFSYNKNTKENKED